MLKDIFKSKEKKEETKKEEMIKSLMDGYVDIKAYKHNEDGTKNLVYHDTGDNTITDWMRHVIMLLLSGYSLTYKGSTSLDINDGNSDPNQVSKPYVGNFSSYHNFQSNTNVDGYCLNGKQYIWDNDDIPNYKLYPVDGDRTYYTSIGEKDTFALFPTKILLGTGCEYTDWESLKFANEEENSTWYAQKIEEYGSGDQNVAEASFNKLVGIGDDDAEFASNKYSGTIGLQGVYTGAGSMIPAVTVNDPDNTSNISTSADMAKRYGVVGAIKTLYCPSTNDSMDKMLMGTVSDSGRLIVPNKRGAGRPCFIYFNRTPMNQKLDWDEITADISVQRDSSTNYLNRLTFRVVIPAQSSGTGSIGVYNPFNGYTFKQVGLFNDAHFATESTASAENNTIKQNMPCGMMLAIKNIQNFSKTADESIEFTWTLTI